MRASEALEITKQSKEYHMQLWSVNKPAVMDALFTDIRRLAKNGITVLCIRNEWVNARLASFRIPTEVVASEIDLDICTTLIELGYGITYDDLHRSITVGWDG